MHGISIIFPKGKRRIDHFGSISKKDFSRRMFMEVDQKRRFPIRRAEEHTAGVQEYPTLPQIEHLEVLGRVLPLDRPSRHFIIFDILLGKMYPCNAWPEAAYHGSFDQVDVGAAVVQGRCRRCGIEWDKSNFGQS